MDIEQANLHQLATEVRGSRGVVFLLQWYGWGEERTVLIWEIWVILLSRSHRVVGVVIGPVQHNRKYALGVEPPVFSLETWSVCVQG